MGVRLPQRVCRDRPGMDGMTRGEPRRRTLALLTGEGRTGDGQSATQEEKKGDETDASRDLENTHDTTSDPFRASWKG